MGNSLSRIAQPSLWSTCGPLSPATPINDEPLWLLSDCSRLGVHGGEQWTPYYVVHWPDDTNPTLGRGFNKTMTRILVTGGLGTVGKVLVWTLRKRGHAVVVSGIEHHHESDYVRCDVASHMQLSRVFDSERFDFVYHLAAEFGRWNGEDYYDRLWMSNVVGTKNLLRMQEKHGFRLIHFSSSEVYGDYDGVMTEDVMDKHEVRQLNDYALTKWVNEQQIVNSAAMHGTQSVRVRLFNMYGPGEY